MSEFETVDRECGDRVRSERGVKSELGPRAAGRLNEKHVLEIHVEMVQSETLGTGEDRRSNCLCVEKCVA